MRAAAINIDVDSLHLYYRIHGLPEADVPNTVWERGVMRFADLLDEVGVKATFFVVASDLDRWPSARKIAAELARAGHELASHSLTHPYDLVRLHDKALRSELEGSKALIEEVRGAPVTGFRAPGYTMTPRVLSLVAEAGYTYDSSIFPSAPYYLAKAAVLTSMALRGKRSHSIIGPPSVMFESRMPSRREGVIELPVTVLPLVRAPFIGTSVIMMRERGYALVRRVVKSVPFVNFELHGIDLCDLAADGIDPALLKQPDLRVPLDDKRAILKRVFTDLRDGWGVDTLERLAPQLAA